MSERVKTFKGSYIIGVFLIIFVLSFILAFATQNVIYFWISIISLVPIFVFLIYVSIKSPWRKPIKIREKSITLNAYLGPFNKKPVVGEPWNDAQQVNRKPLDLTGKELSAVFSNEIQNNSGDSSFGSMVVLFFLIFETKSGKYYSTYLPPGKILTECFEKLLETGLAKTSISYVINKKDYGNAKIFLEPRSK